MEASGEYFEKRNCEKLKMMSLADFEYLNNFEVTLVVALFNNSKHLFCDYFRHIYTIGYRQ